MGRRSAEATKARRMCPSLRAVWGEDFFFAAAELLPELFFDCGEWVFFPDVWPSTAAWNGTRRDRREMEIKRLSSTAFQLPRKTGPHERNVIVGQNPDQFLGEVVGGSDSGFRVALVIRGAALLD